MFRKALVCTDLSEASDCLVNCVGQLRAVGLEEAILAHVIYVANNTPSLEVMVAEEAAPALERQKKLLEDQRISVFLEMPTGIPSYTLNELAEKHDVSLIVIGSHGGGILRRAVLGSVSYELLHVATRPVFLGRIETMGSQGRGFIPELFLGSVSHNVVRHAPVPVLLVPASQ